MTATAAKRGAARKRPATRSEVIGMRVTAKDRAEIERRAERYGLTLTDYMVRCSLGQVLDERSLEERVAELERRVAQLAG